MIKKKEHKETKGNKTRNNKKIKRKSRETTKKNAIESNLYKWQSKGKRHRSGIRGRQKPRATAAAATAAKVAASPQRRGKRRIQKNASNSCSPSRQRWRKLNPLTQEGKGDVVVKRKLSRKTTPSESNPPTPPRGLRGLSLSVQQPVHKKRPAARQDPSSPKSGESGVGERLQGKRLGLRHKTHS